MNMMSESQVEKLVSNTDLAPAVKMRGEKVELYYGEKRALHGVDLDSKTG